MHLFICVLSFFKNELKFIFVKKKRKILFHRPQKIAFGVKKKVFEPKTLKTFTFNPPRPPNLPKCLLYFLSEVKNVLKNFFFFFNWFDLYPRHVTFKISFDLLQLF